MALPKPGSRKALQQEVSSWAVCTRPWPAGAGRSPPPWGLPGQEQAEGGPSASLLRTTNPELPHGPRHRQTVWESPSGRVGDLGEKLRD